MPVQIKSGGKPISKKSMGAAERRLRQYAAILLAKQGDGFITPRELKDALNAAGILNPLGSCWTESSVYRMLKLGRSLGLPFKLRTRRARYRYVANQYHIPGR